MSRIVRTLSLRMLFGVSALLLAAPSQATELPYTLTGTLSGSKLSYTCDPYSPGGGCPVVTTFTQDFGVIAYLDLHSGTNSFDFGNPVAPPGEYVGTIISDDTLTGLNLSWGWSNCSPGFIEGCVAMSGTASSFRVQSGAVPEPSTWVMMVLGFGVGAGMIRSGRRRQKLDPSAA